jgi:hypothetical protein
VEVVTMTDRAEASLKNWGALAAALAATLTIALFVARSVAQAEVAPIDRRVTRLEAQREEDVKRLEEIRADLKDVKQLLEAQRAR